MLHPNILYHYILPNYINILYILNILEQERDFCYNKKY